MILNLETYVINRSFIQNWHNTSDICDADISSGVSKWAASLQCPCLVLYFYLAEDIGYIPEIKESIQRLIDFYGYTEILNQQKESPFSHYDSSS